MVNDGSHRLDFRKLGLTDTDLSVLALHFYDGWSYADIATMYGIAKQSIADRINKVRKILKANSVPLPKQLQRPTTGERIKVISLDPSHFDLFTSHPERNDDE